MVDHMLTTVDNPFDPFTDFDAWYSFDLAHGYDTPGFLARIVKTSDGLSQSDQDQALEDAIDEIVKENITGVYKKVTAQS
jgi:hypothetical protein